MIGDELNNAFALHSPNSQSSEDDHSELRQLDEIIRLLEIRVEELEKTKLGVSLSIRVKK